jgi:8-oxo-dGTP pyrophosphatase MutT (NUDIX family)
LHLQTSRGAGRPKWLHLSGLATMALVDRESIEKNLRRFEPRESQLAQTPAAVAIVILLDGEVPMLPIFQRPLNMRRHAGQMALPGGRLHDGEDAAECALRELAEELGVTIGRGEVLGRLDDFDTRSGFTITPVVVWSGAPATTLHPSPTEVARLFLIPALELQQAVGAAAQVPPDEFSLKFREVEVFAPTAAMLHQFSEVALDGRSTRVSDFHQPPWTHR